MQFRDYKIADIKDKTEIVERLAKIETDLSKDVGSDVVLIAYQKSETAKV